MINPVILFKMLFLCHLYNISEREVEEQVNFNIVMKYFCDLVPEDRSPDHSTLSIFKERILETNKKLKKNILKELFNEIINKASKL
jgi:IS5 family transposase